MVRTRHTATKRLLEASSFLVPQKAFEIMKPHRFNKSLLPPPDIQQHGERGCWGGGAHGVHCCHRIVMDVIAELDPGAPALGKSNQEKGSK